MGRRWMAVILGPRILSMVPKTSKSMKKKVKRRITGSLWSPKIEGADRGRENPAKKTCQYCKTMTYSRLKNLLDHENECQKKDKFFCQPCSSMFFSMEELKAHKISRTHLQNTKERTKEDLELDAEVERTRQNALQLQVHEIPDPYFINDLKCLCWKCPQCNASWDPKIDGDEKDKNYENKKIPKFFKKSCYDSYKKHVEENHNGNFFACIFCPDYDSGITKERLKQESVFKHHMIKEHSMRCKDKQSYYCQLPISSKENCEYRCERRHLMELHLTSYHFTHLKKDTQCDACGATFRQMSKFNLHMKRHQGERHVCNQCGKECLDLRGLTLHQRIHIPATLECPDCLPAKNGEKKKYNLHSLKDHRDDVHNKKHKCPNCDWASGLPGDLADHFRTKHMNYLRYQCTKCDKQFSDSTNSKFHYQNVHEKNLKRKIDSEFFKRNKGVIKDRKVTDPNYPTKEEIEKILKDIRSEPP